MATATNTRCRRCGDDESQHLSNADGSYLKPFRTGVFISGACRARHQSGGIAGISQTCGCTGFKPVIQVDCPECGSEDTSTTEPNAQGITQTTCHVCNHVEVC